MGRSYVGEGADIRILQAWCHALSALFAQELRDLHYSNTESFAGPKKNVYADFTQNGAAQKQLHFQLEGCSRKT